PPTAARLTPPDDPTALPEGVLRALVNGATDSVQVANAAGRFVYVNDEATRRTGISRERFLTLHVSALEPLFDDPGSWEAHVAEVQARGGLTLQSRNRRLSGDLFPVEVAVKWVETVEGGYIVAISRDISAREEVARARAETDALERAKGELERANRELERASQAKDDFLASMSHELRTPLNSILGLSEALLESIYGELNPEQTQSVRHITRSGEHLLNLISDILDISKIRAGGLKLHAVDVDVEAVCSEVVQQFKPEMRRKQLSFSLSIEGSVYLLRADERWFKQMLMNLLSNAVKFTPTGKRVGLKVHGDVARRALRVTVWDEGIGIKQQDLSRLFQSFVQLDTSLARVYQGTGLGLSIVASVMELHGGKASVESVFGVGSRFHLDFPWQPADSVPLPTDFTPVSAELIRALVVEDSEVDAARLTRFLTELGTEVYVDPTGAIALSEAARVAPNVILLDLHLPERSGAELIRQLRAHPSTALLPIVVCSVLSPSEAQIPAELVDAYLVKPIGRRELRRAIRRILGAGDPRLGERASLDEPLEDSRGEGWHDEASRREDPLSEPHEEARVQDPGEARGEARGEAPEERADAPAGAGEEASAPRRALVVSAHEADPQAPPALLVVDDNLSNIQLVQDYLSRKGYRLLTAEDGYQAVQVARALHPRLILMDVQMPHMDGIEATRHLKADPTTREIPVFALTALAMPGDRERCLEAGMEQYFTKPVSLRALSKSIAERLGLNINS
ncbi:MAG: response regulator, partial [Deltaproteobacteria bacterium]|nr:response regulator [Deltaproteobacteria bacterium]